MRSCFILLIPLILLTTCRDPRATDFNFPIPVDTTTRPIQFQEKKTFEADGVYADNQFDGARLNDFMKIKDNTFQASITPENSPINMSPWYSFRLWSEKERLIRLILHYEEGRHRYAPKISPDGETWTALDSSFFSAYDTASAILDLNIGPDTLWISAQELVTSQDVRHWCLEMARHPSTHFETIGKSSLGRDLFFLDIDGSPSRGKESIIIMSRQHPPEVTGYFAMQAFIEEILADNALSNAFRKKYRLLVFPLMNPDGVDLGHWRHNAGGIDLNRDWAFYNQPETRQVADFIVKTLKEDKSKALLGIDFHSTWNDIYYTGSDNLTAGSNLPNFKNYWLIGIAGAIENYEPREGPSGLEQPVSKGWFFSQLNAEGVTYEIGDNTPRDFIRHKGEVAAREMMSLLIYRDSD